MTDNNRDPQLVAAELDKLTAEAERERAQAALFVREMALREADTRKLTAHARSAEYGTESMRVQTEATLRQEKLNLAQNHLHHTHYFWGEVDEDTVESCLVQMAVWDRTDSSCPMHIVMNSPGGLLNEGMHLFDDLAAYSIRGGGTHQVKMTVRARAASMAGILLQAADERVMGPESYLLIHQVSSWAGGSIGELKDKMKWLDMVSERVVNIFLARAGGKISREQFESNWERKDWWLTAQQAVDLGFADRVG